MSIHELRIRAEACLASEAPTPAAAHTLADVETIIALERALERSEERLRRAEAEIASLKAR